MSKLYKLVKITRLIRLFKLMKAENKVMKKLGTALQIGAAFERLSFFFLILLLLCHFFGCLWIFCAKNLEDPDVEGDNWIEAGGY